MALSWRGRRQLNYYLVGIVFLLVVGWGFYTAFLTSAPTCFDGSQDGDETGVDCGGSSCSLICVGQSRDPQVLWARSFPSDLVTGSVSASGEGQTNLYTAVAYVRNLNVGAAAKNVHYSFQLFDEKNLLIVERDGVANLPPQNTIPIIETNVNVGARTVARTLFAFSDNSFVWRKVPQSELPSLHVSNQELSSDASKLTATIQNDSLHDAEQVTLTAILFDAQGTARGASRSVLERVPAEGREAVVFTWPQKVPDIVRAEITILPSF